MAIDPTTGAGEVPPARSYLYVPGHRPELIEKALASGADAIVVDLEDGIPPSKRGDALRSLEQFGRAIAASRPRPLFGVRLGGTTDAHRDEVALAVGVGAAFLRLPKVTSAAEVERVGGWLAALQATHLSAPGVGLQPVIETAEGVLDVRAIAGAPGVIGVAVGAADLAADLGLPPGADEALDAVKVMLVLASAAARLVQPVESIFVATDDEDGLRSSTARSHALGMFGRSAIHPRQIAVINDVFTPRASDVAAAERVVAAGEAADGGATLSAGELVDAPIVLRARRVLALRDRFGQGSVEP